MEKIINILKSSTATTQTTTPTADQIVEQITSPILVLVNVILGIVAVFGIVVLVKGIVELIPAIQDRDSAGMWQAGKGLLVGVLLMSISLIVKIFYPGI